MIREDQLTVAPGPEAVVLVQGWIEDIAARDKLSADLTFGLTLCLDEAVTNVLSYAFKQPCLNPLIQVSYQNSEEGTVIVLRDNGCPFDPTASQLSPLARSLDDAVPGGHGVRLMRHYLDSITYRREAGWNQLVMVTFHRKPAC